MADITLGVGVAYETTKVNLSNIDKVLGSIRVGAPEGIKDLISTPTYYEATVVFGASIVSSDGAELASKEYNDRLKNMSGFELFSYLMGNQTGTLGGTMAGEGLGYIKAEPFAAIGLGAGVGVGAHGGVDFEFFVSVGHFNDLDGLSIAGEAQVLPYAIQGGGLAVPIGSYPGDPGTKAYLMRSAEKILQPNGALEFEYTIIVSGTYATKLAREIVNGDVQINEIADYVSQQIDNHCFLSDTPIQMWPLDPMIKPRVDGSYDEAFVLSKVWEKPISKIKVGDIVVAYDDKGRLGPKRVLRTVENRATHVLDFWGTGVTPGHAYYCAEGRFEGRHVPLMDILRTDGAIMRADGTLVRAATNCELGSEGDQFIHAIVGDRQANGQIVIRNHAEIRLGTRVILENGTDVSVQELIAASGSKVTDEGLIRTSNGQELPFHWSFSHELPQPEDYILKRSDVSLDEICQANEWEQIGTQLAAPDGASNGIANNGLMMQPSKPLPNLPPAFANHPDAPKGASHGKLNTAWPQ